MNIQHFEKGLQLQENERLMLAKKILRLTRYCEKLKDEASFIRFEAERRPTEKTQDQVKVMINLTLPKKTLRAESRREHVLDAVDRCVDKLEPQLKKYKELHTGRGRARKGR